MRHLPFGRLLIGAMPAGFRVWRGPLGRLHRPSRGSARPLAPKIRQTQLTRRAIPCFLATVLFASIVFSGEPGFHHTLLHETTSLILRSTQRTQAASNTKPGGGKILYYQDPMHPWYRSDKPGIAPDCGMKLVPVYASQAPARRCHRAQSRSVPSGSR